jgi:hypothetical protein
MSGKQRRLALATLRAIFQALACHTIGRVAVRTDDMQFLGHSSPFEAFRPLGSCTSRKFPQAVVWLILGKIGQNQAVTAEG